MLHATAHSALIITKPYKCNTFVMYLHLLQEHMLGLYVFDKTLLITKVKQFNINKNELPNRRQ